MVEQPGIKSRLAREGLRWSAAVQGRFFQDMPDAFADILPYLVQRNPCCGTLLCHQVLLGSSYGIRPEYSSYQPQPAYPDSTEYHELPRR